MLAAESVTAVFSVNLPEGTDDAKLDAVVEKTTGSGNTFATDFVTNYNTKLADEGALTDLCANGACAVTKTEATSATVVATPLTSAVCIKPAQTVAGYENLPDTKTKVGAKTFRGAADEAAASRRLTTLKCAQGWKGTAKAECSADGAEYTLTGCTKKSTPAPKLEISSAYGMTGAVAGVVVRTSVLMLSAFMYLKM